MDKRLVVAIDTWECDSMYPSGHYVRTLGTIGDRDTETVREQGKSGDAAGGGEGVCVDTPPPPLSSPPSPSHLSAGGPPH